MKFPWSKKDYPYSRHSAPVTNGILRNGQGATAADRPPSSSGLRVSFTADSSLTKLAAECATLDLSDPGPRAARRSSESAVRVKAQSEDEQPRARRRSSETAVRERAHSKKEYPKGSGDKSSGDSRDSHRDRRPKAADDRRRQRNTPEPDPSVSSKELREKLHHPRRGSASSKTPQTNKTNASASDPSSSSEELRQKLHQRKERRGSSTLSSSEEVRKPLNPRRGRRGSSSLNSSWTSTDPPAQRLRDMTPEKIASCYKKWESNETMDTVDTDFSERSSAKGSTQSLDELLDQKIEAKMLRRGLRGQDLSMLPVRR